MCLILTTTTPKLGNANCRKKFPGWPTIKGTGASKEREYPPFGSILFKMSEGVFFARNFRSSRALLMQQ
jgi:hypothetical protein